MTNKLSNSDKTTDHFFFEMIGAPPSLNQMLQDSRIKRGVVYNKRKKEWHLIVMSSISRPWPRFVGPVAIEFERGWCGVPCDMDNVSPKYVLDALVNMGVLKSDDPRIVTGLLITQKRYSSRKEIRTCVRIRTVEKGATVNLQIK